MIRRQTINHRVFYLFIPFQLVGPSTEFFHLNNCNGLTKNCKCICAVKFNQVINFINAFDNAQCVTCTMTVLCQRFYLCSNWSLSISVFVECTDRLCIYFSVFLHFLALYSNDYESVTLCSSWHLLKLNLNKSETNSNHHYWPTNKIYVQ